MIDLIALTLAYVSGAVTWPILVQLTHRGLKIARRRRTRRYI